MSYMRGIPDRRRTRRRKARRRANNKPLPEPKPALPAFLSELAPTGEGVQSPDPSPAPSPVALSSPPMTKRQIMGELDELGVDYDARMKKRDLAALLEAALLDNGNSS